MPQHLEKPQKLPSLCSTHLPFRFQGRKYPEPTVKASPVPFITNNQWPQFTTSKTSPHHYFNPLRLERLLYILGIMSLRMDHPLTPWIDTDPNTCFIRPYYAFSVVNSPILILQCPIKTFFEIFRLKPGFSCCNITSETSFIASTSNGHF